ncbi:MAG: DUF2628 domain-containing protein [Sphingomonas sp.]
MARNDYADFLRDPDQPARRAELEAFFGPNAHKFLPVYDRLQADFARTGKPGFSLRGGGFSVPAFLCGPCWFLYRKMWAIAAIVVAVGVALAFLPVGGGAGIGIGIALGAFAYRAYVQHAIAAITRMRRRDGAVRLDALRFAGGVSRAAGWISGLIYGGVTLLALASIIYLASIGAAVPR